MIKTVILQANTPKEIVAAIQSALEKTRDFVRINSLPSGEWSIVVTIEDEEDFASVLGTIVEVTINVKRVV